MVQLVRQLAAQFQKSIDHLVDDAQHQVGRARGQARTRAVLEALPRRPQFDSDPAIAAGFRMRALLQAAELSLMDEHLPLHPTSKA